MLTSNKLLVGVVMIIMKRILLVLTIATGLSVGSPIQAQNLSYWEFQGTAYVWKSGLKGTLGTFSGALPVDVYGAQPWWLANSFTLNGALTSTNPMAARPLQRTKKGD